MIMSTLMLASASGHEDRRRDAGLVGDIAERDLRFVARKGDAGHHVLFHDVLLLANQRAQFRIGGIVEGRAHVEPDPVHHRRLDRAHLQHLGAERGQLEHFLERHLVEPARLGHHARVGGVDAVDVGVDVAAVGVERRGERHRRGVRAAAPERRHPAARRMNALEAGDDRDLAARETLDDRLAIDVLDARRAVRVVGLDRDLPALPRTRLEPHVLEHDRQQAGGDEFARGDHRVVFGGVVDRRRVAAPGDQLVGLARHRRDNHRDLGAGLDLAFDVARDVANAFDIGDRSAAELHHQTRHEISARGKGAARVAAEARV